MDIFIERTGRPEVKHIARAATLIVPEPVVSNLTLLSNTGSFSIGLAIFTASL